MASGEVLLKLRGSYSKAEYELKRWNSAQVLIGTCQTLSHCALPPDEQMSANAFAARPFICDLAELCLVPTQERIVSLLGTASNVLGRLQVRFSPPSQARIAAPPFRHE